MDEGDYNWGIATLVFVFLPGLINAAIGLVILTTGKRFYATSAWVLPCIGVGMYQGKTDGKTASDTLEGRCTSLDATMPLRNEQKTLLTFLQPTLSTTVMSFCLVGPLFWYVTAILLMLGCFKIGASRKTSQAFKNTDGNQRIKISMQSFGCFALGTAHMGQDLSFPG